MIFWRRRSIDWFRKGNGKWYFLVYDFLYYEWKMNKVWLDAKIYINFKEKRWLSTSRIGIVIPFRIGLSHPWVGAPTNNIIPNPTFSLLSQSQLLQHHQLSNILFSINHFRSIIPLNTMVLRDTLLEFLFLVVVFKLAPDINRWLGVD